mgnify:CR=1 FL=1
MLPHEHYQIDHIIESLINGQFKQAKEQTQEGCKTNPERQARKVGQVVGTLCGPDYNMPGLAGNYLNLFDADPELYYR